VGAGPPSLKRSGREHVDVRVGSLICPCPSTGSCLGRLRPRRPRSAWRELVPSRPASCARARSGFTHGASARLRAASRGRSAELLEGPPTGRPVARCSTLVWRAPRVVRPSCGAPFARCSRCRWRRCRAVGGARALARHRSWWCRGGGAGAGDVRSPAGRAAVRGSGARGRSLHREACHLSHGAGAPEPFVRGRGVGEYGSCRRLEGIA
jgi:hypothetical protein